MERDRMTQLSAMVTGRRYLLLTTAATAIAAAGAAQRMQELPPSASLPSYVPLFASELLNSRISAVIVLHFFLVAMYHAFLLLAHVALGALRPLELQQTKETLIPFVLLRCQLLVSTMEPAAHGQRAELGLLVVWLAALAVLRALLALTQARFQHLLTRPMTQLRDLQKLGAVLAAVLVLNLGLATMCSRLGLFSDRIVHVPWFEASLMLLRTLELGVQVGFHSLDVSAANSSDQDEDASSGYSENSEFHLLLLQTVLCGCYLVQLVLYYLYVISVDQFRVSLFDLILILNVKNATVRLLEKVKHVKLYHQVVLDLDHRFPDATPDELASVADDVCAICLKSMPTQAKKLRCGHLFHRLCLRQCLQKASVSDALAGLDPLTRMANGLGMEGSPPPGVAAVAGSASPGSTSMRCPICRKQVCGEKCDDVASGPSGGHRPLQPEAEADEPREGGQQQLVNATAQNAEGELQAQAAPGGDAAAPEEVLRFSTAFLSRWVPFPNFSFEIVRHRGGVRNFEVTPEMLQQIWEVFPQYTLEEIRADLNRTRSVERTMERILNGRLDEQRVAMERRNPDGVDMAADGVLGDAVIDLGEDFRWSISTLVSALLGTPNQPPVAAMAATPAVVGAEGEAARPIDGNNGDANANVNEVDRRDAATEPLLRRLERWRGQPPM